MFPQGILQVYVIKTYYSMWCNALQSYTYRLADSRDVKKNKSHNPTNTLNRLKLTPVRLTISAGVSRMMLTLLLPTFSLAKERSTLFVSVCDTHTKENGLHTQNVTRVYSYIFYSLMIYMRELTLR